MSFGFDAIDRQFRRKEPIKLECTCCGKTDNVKSRPDIDGEPALCAVCHHFKVIEIFGD